jgi:serine phosphatase RsbU (regulator of sigma subunit)
MKRFFTIGSLFICCLGFAQRVDSLRAVVNGHGPDSLRIKAMIYLSEAIRRNDLSEGIELYKRAIQLTDSVHAHPRFIAFAQMGIGYCMMSSGEMDSSIYYYETALKYFQKTKSLANIAGCDNGLANAYSQLGQYGKALQYYFDGLSIATKSNDKEKQASIFGNIANTYANMDDAKSSLKYHLLAINLRTELGDSSGLITNYNNLSDLYLNLGMLKEAEDILTKQWRLIQKYGDANDTAYYFSMEAKLLVEKKDYPNALMYFNKAIALDTVIGEVSSAYANTIEIGLVYLSMHDTTTANKYIREGIAGLRAMDELPLIEDSYEAIADRYAEIGMPMEAYKLLKKLLILQDTLHSQELNELIAKKEAGYANEKKQHEYDNIKKNAEIDALQLSRTKYLIAFLVVAVLIVLGGVFLLLKRNRAKQFANDQLEQQNAEITMQKKSITDSINYAKKIQDSILPPEHQIKRVLPNSFILYEPKDVVSGDFYWLDSRDNYSIFAAVDCTGHGVPGALMSVVGFNLLNQAVNEMGLTKPAEIIHHLDYGVNKLLRQSDGGNTVKDGMDLALCSYDSSTRKLQYAGVFNPAYIITKGEFVQLKPDKFPIGINADGVTDIYTNHECQLYPGDMIYLFSDGYADQFGGAMGKKYKYLRFRDLLLKIHKLPCEEQKLILKKEFVDWKGGLEQVDDILVIGVRVE